jgi:hypothetical protein
MDQKFWNIRARRITPGPNRPCSRLLFCTSTGPSALSSCSLDAQNLPCDRFEIIVVDNGSAMLRHRDPTSGRTVAALGSVGSRSRSEHRRWRRTRRGDVRVSSARGSLRELYAKRDGQIAYYRNVAEGPPLANTLDSRLSSYSHRR